MLYVRIANEDGTISFHLLRENNIYVHCETCLTVSDAAINLGMLHTDRLLYLDDKETSEFAYKLIEYALLREEVRRDKKKDKTQGCHRWTCSKNEVTQ